MNIDEKLRELEAVSHGSYYIARCPECGHREAFIYLDDIIKHQSNPEHKIAIRCNRLNKCGKTTYIEDVKVDKIPEAKIEEDRIGQVAIDKLSILANNPELLLDFDFNWRGISNNTLKAYHIIYFKPEFKKFIEICGNAFPEKYWKKRCYENRDLIIPILDYDGKVERVLLRDTKLRDTKRKEIGVKLKKNASEVWNKEDILDENKKVLFVTEGVPDALSIKEVMPEAGVVAIPGVRKYKQVIKELKKVGKPEEKRVVICFDNDEAGKQYSEKFRESLMKLKIEVTQFELGEYKDINEILQADRKKLEKKISRVMNPVVQFRIIRNRNQIEKKKKYTN